MPLHLTTYDIALARDGIDLEKALEAGEGDGYDQYTVTVLHADQLVAEQAAPRYGITALDAENAQKITWATLWVWCALRRRQVEVPEFPRFKSRVLELKPQTKNDGETGETGEGELVDPTRATGGTPSPSPWPDTGPGSTGSPPTTD